MRHQTEAQKRARAQTRSVAGNRVPNEADPKNLQDAKGWGGTIKDSMKSVTILIPAY